MPRIPDFVARHPEITLNFATRIGQFDFDKEGLDAAIYVGRPNWAGADCTFFMHETVAPVCSPEFLAEHPVGAAEDLLELPLLHMASRPESWTYWFESLGVSYHSGRGMRFEQFSNVAEACIAGLGVALMPLFLIQSELHSQQLAPAFDHQVSSAEAYYFVTPLRAKGNAAVSKFRQWILAQF